MDTGNGELPQKDLEAVFGSLPLGVDLVQSSSNKFPAVFIVFDEAHSLTKPLYANNSTSRNDFSELRRVLSLLNQVSLFTIFLSTTGKISQFTPPRGHDPSNRMNYGTFKIPHPFIYLGFDQLVGSDKMFCDKYKTLNDVTTLECISRMGRPL